MEMIQPPPAPNQSYLGLVRVQPVKTLVNNAKREKESTVGSGSSRHSDVNMSEVRVSMTCCFKHIPNAGHLD